MMRVSDIKRLLKERGILLGHGVRNIREEPTGVDTEEDPRITGVFMDCLLYTSSGGIRKGSC